MEQVREFFFINGVICLVKIKPLNLKGFNVVFIFTDNSRLKHTNMCCSCARSCLLSQNISDYHVNTRPWGPSRGLHRRAASLLGWKWSLSQTLIVKELTNIFSERFRGRSRSPLITLYTPVTTNNRNFATQYHIVKLNP